jgi:5-methyltetrahydropteroyltriglutamate--homocysteine methyltransferase
VASTRRSPRLGSSCRSTARTWRWVGTSNTPTCPSRNSANGRGSLRRGAEPCAGCDPPERVRHLCWGNYEGPHHPRRALAEIIDVVFAARPATISFEAANPRHAHEWTLFERVKLPEGKTIVPGVIESKSTFIEHPELIAQRIARYANLVGRDNVIAGSDCGFGTWVGQAVVDPDVVWAKLAAIAEGARLATKQFWGA